MMNDDTWTEWDTYRALSIRPGHISIYEGAVHFHR
jgi:hypothetical protein